MRLNKKNNKIVLICVPMLAVGLTTLCYFWACAQSSEVALRDQPPTERTTKQDDGPTFGAYAGRDEIRETDAEEDAVVGQKLNSPENRIAQSESWNAKSGIRLDDDFGDIDDDGDGDIYIGAEAYDVGLGGGSGLEGQLNPIAPPVASRAPASKKLMPRRGGREGQRGRRGRARGFNFRGMMSPNPVDHRAQLARYPGALPSEDEELWIIQRVTTERRTKLSNDRPGCGALLAQLPQQEKQVPVPLEHTDVNASISAYIATVDVTQKYTNPFDTKIEAVYVFPLPQNAAINEFIMTVGDRKIRGIIRDRTEAQQIYNQAKRAGKVASLLTQERPNVFTQKVANIEPGKKIDINIKYFHTLAYNDGWYEWVFPMVVGPRFNPPGSTNGIGAMPHGGNSGQSTNVAYLTPNERSGHDISLQVDIDAGVSIERIKSVNHVIENNANGNESRLVKLSPRDSIPNKDFVLRYKVAGDRIKSALLTHRSDDGAGYFSMMIYPPEEVAHLSRQPVEMIFVLDCSGSMNGKPIEQAKAAIKRGLRSLKSNDTFQVIRFSNNASQFGDRPVIASRENLHDAVRYVDGLNGSGGTMMIEGIKAALDFPHDDNRLRFVCFMTDGFIGNEAEILGTMHEKLGSSRIFSFGVGSSPNRFLMNRMAKMGNGAVAYLSLNDSGADVMDDFFERISHPALTDLKIDWGGMQVTEVYPERVPDLFVGRPVIVTGRYAGTPSGTIRVTGEVGDRISEVVINPHADRAAHNGLAAVWARTKIADMVDRSMWQDAGNIATEIKQLALDYSLMSQFTAFVAVDSLSQTAGDYGTTVQVPVPTPDGVKYETTVTGASGS